MQSIVSSIEFINRKHTSSCLNNGLLFVTEKVLDCVQHRVAVYLKPRFRLAYSQCNHLDCTVNRASGERRLNFGRHETPCGSLSKKIGDCPSFLPVSQLIEHPAMRASRLSRGSIRALESIVRPSREVNWRLRSCQRCSSTAVLRTSPSTQHLPLDRRWQQRRGAAAAAAAM